MNFASILFPPSNQCNHKATLLLVARVIFGILLALHGYAKLQMLTSGAPIEGFIDFMGLGMRTSLTLAMLAEFVCSIAVIIGLLTRLALIPMAFTMLVALGTVHQWVIFNPDPSKSGELAFLYLVCFVLLIFAGPGKYSVDGLIGKKLGL